MSKVYGYESTNGASQPASQHSTLTCCCSQTILCDICWWYGTAKLREQRQVLNAHVGKYIRSAGDFKLAIFSHCTLFSCFLFLLLNLILPITLFGELIVNFPSGSLSLRAHSLSHSCSFLSILFAWADASTTIHYYQMYGSTGMSFEIFYRNSWARNIHRNTRRYIRNKFNVALPWFDDFPVQFFTLVSSVLGATKSNIKTQFLIFVFSSIL